MLKNFRLANGMLFLNDIDVKEVMDKSEQIIDVFKAILPCLEFRELSSFHTMGRDIRPMYDDMGHLIESIDELTEAVCKGTNLGRNGLSPKEVSYFTYATAPQNKLGTHSRVELAARLDSSLSDLIRACNLARTSENGLKRRMHPIAHDLIIIAKECVKDSQ